MEPERGSLLTVRDLSVAYGQRTVLRDVSLDVAAGEMVGLIGPNGSGKTTLLRAVTRVVRPATGRVSLLGDDTAFLPQAELARRIAVVPQNPPLPEAFTVWEVVLMGRTPHLRLLQSEGKADLEVVRRALAETDIMPLAGRRIGELSGGERQRVVIARALAQQTPVLLLDEPTAQLDLGHQATVWGMVQRLCREQGLAVVAAVHDLSIAAQFCSRLVLLKDGSVVAEGQPDEVLTPAMLEQVYGTQVYVLRHPVNGRPVVLPAAADRPVIAGEG